MEKQSIKTFINLFNKVSSWTHNHPMPELCVDDVVCTNKTNFTTVGNPTKEHPVSSVFDTDRKTTSSVTLASIADTLALCKRCSLCKDRKNTVPGFGVEKALVMVIGEGPGAEEDMQGLPFVGPAGQLLDKMLASIQLSRHTNCFIGNIVKCRPPHNRDPSPEEAAACASFLHAQIHIIKPKMILAVGRIAAQSLLGTKEGIGKLHGRFFDYPSTDRAFSGASQSKDVSIPLMATYHPSALLRDASYKKPAWEDLKLFRSQLEVLVPDYAKEGVKGFSDGSGGSE